MNLINGLSSRPLVIVHHWLAGDVELGGWLDLGLTIGVWAGAVAIAFTAAMLLIELSDWIDRLLTLRSYRRATLARLKTLRTSAPTNTVSRRCAARVFGQRKRS